MAKVLWERFFDLPGNADILTVVSAECHRRTAAVCRVVMWLNRAHVFGADNPLVFTVGFSVARYLEAFGKKGNIELSQVAWVLEGGQEAPVSFQCSRMAVIRDFSNVENSDLVVALRYQNTGPQPELYRKLIGGPFVWERPRLVVGNLNCLDGP